MLFTCILFLFRKPVNVNRGFRIGKESRQAVSLRQALIRKGGLQLSLQGRAPLPSAQTPGCREGVGRARQGAPGKVAPGRSKPSGGSGGSLAASSTARPGDTAPPAPSIWGSAPIWSHLPPRSPFLPSHPRACRPSSWAAQGETEREWAAFGGAHGRGWSQGARGDPAATSRKRPAVP